MFHNNGGVINCEGEPALEYEESFLNTINDNVGNSNNTP
jgi:hypothetical protein